MIQVTQERHRGVAVVKKVALQIVYLAVGKGHSSADLLGPRQDVEPLVKETRPEEGAVETDGHHLPRIEVVGHDRHCGRYVNDRADGPRVKQTHFVAEVRSGLEL